MSLRMFSAVLVKGGASVLRTPATAPSVWKIVGIREIQTSAIQRQDKHISGFSFAGMKKHYEVLPMVFICVGAVVAVLGFSTYQSRTRPEIVFTRAGNLEAKMDLKNPPHLKMYDVKPADRSLPEVADLYREMALAEKELEKESAAQK